MSNAAQRASMFGDSKQANKPAGGGGGGKKKKTLEEVLKEGEWQEKKDEKSGKSYYYSKKSRETVWDLVKHLDLEPSSGSSGAASSGGGGGGGGGGKKTVEDFLHPKGPWQKKKDEKSGKDYYYNKETKATTWNLEKELGLLDTKSSGGGEKKKTLQDFLVPKGEWKEFTDQKTQKKYYSHAKTKKTVWQDKIYQELGIDDPAEEEAKRKKKEQEEKEEAEKREKENAEPPKSVAEAIERGLWTEHHDPRSGKKFYVEASSKRTVWNLAKELGLENDDDKTLEEQEEEHKKPPTVEELLAAGVWKQLKDYRGLPYFIKPATGEACADLELYLKIRRELDGGPSAESRKKTATGIPAMKDWVELFTQGRDSDAAEKRLMNRATKLEVNDARFAAAEAKKNEEMLKKQISLRDQEITNLRALLSMQNREVQQLQCALFYGMGGNAYHKTVNSSAAASGGGSENYQPSKLLLPPPPLDVEIARDDNHPENVARRIATLERLVFDLQSQNRTLLEQVTVIESEKHRHANCSSCVEGDPFQRLLNVQSSPSRPRLVPGTQNYTY